MAEIYKMTEEQKKLLESLEEEFKNRYTEEDEDYKRILTGNGLTPPIVDRWEGGNDRNDRNHRNDRYNHRNDRRRDYRNNDYDRRDYRNSYGRGYRDDSYERNYRPNYRHRPY